MFLDMGMFDTIAWSDSVPTSPEMDELGLSKRDWEFQTKDLDEGMELYCVQDGRLYIQKHRVNEFVEGDPKAKDWQDQFGYFKREDPYWEFVSKTATIRMYDYRQNVMQHWDCSIDYEAVFVDGILTSIKLTNFEKRDNSDRIKRDQEWKDRWERENNLWYNRLIFHTRPYIFCSRHLRRLLYSLSESILTFANKL